MNIVEKLKNAPVGIKLYSPLYGEVKFYGIMEDIDYPISTITDDEIQYFTFDGRYYNKFKNGECILFPSKENRDWNNFFPYKQGVPYMVSDNKVNWLLRYYAGDGKFYLQGEKGDCNAVVPYKYIIPFKDFNPEDYK